MNTRFAALSVMGTWIAVALVAPWLAAEGSGLVPFGPDAFHADALFAMPDRIHWLGADDRGRDVLSRLVHGSRLAIGVGVSAAAGASLLGLTLGLVAGWNGRWLDVAAQRLADVVGSLPGLVLLLAMRAAWGPDRRVLVVVLASLGSVSVFRLVRGEVRAIVSANWLDAARVTGLREHRILLGHVLPSVLGSVRAFVPFLCAGAILAEASLSFLGVGNADFASWGEVLAQGRSYADRGAWHLVVFPSCCLFATTWAMFRLADASPPTS